MIPPAVAICRDPCMLSSANQVQLHGAEFDIVIRIESSRSIATTVYCWVGLLLYSAYRKLQDDAF